MMTTQGNGYELSSSNLDTGNLLNDMNSIIWERYYDINDSFIGKRLSIHIFELPEECGGFNLLSCVLSYQQDDLGAFFPILASPFVHCPTNSVRIYDRFQSAIVRPICCNQILKLQSKMKPKLMPREIVKYSFVRFQ